MHILQSIWLNSDYKPSSKRNKNDSYLDFYPTYPNKKEKMYQSYNKTFSLANLENCLKYMISRI